MCNKTVSTTDLKSLKQLRALGFREIHNAEDEAIEVGDRDLMLLIQSVMVERNYYRN
ncbi:MAG: hypothetical protein QM500_04935 [Methylococcales bacterium]